MVKVKFKRNVEINESDICVKFEINGCCNIKELHNHIDVDIDEDEMIEKYLEILDYLEYYEYILDSNYPRFEFIVEKCRIGVKDITNEFIECMVNMLKKVGEKVKIEKIGEKTIKVDKEGCRKIINIERCVEKEPDGYAVWFVINGKKDLKELYETLELWSVDKSDLIDDTIKYVIEEIEREKFIVGYIYPYFHFKVDNYEDIEKLTELFLDKFYKLLDDYEKINEEQDLYDWVYESYEIDIDI